MSGRNDDDHPGLGWSDDSGMMSAASSGPVSHDRWRKCRKRPVVVEFREARPGETIQTREGELKAQPGDLIIRGIEGELYPIGRDIFERTYDPAPTPEEDRRTLPPDAAEFLQVFAEWGCNGTCRSLDIPPRARCYSCRAAVILAHHGEPLQRSSTPTPEEGRSRPPEAFCAYYFSLESTGVPEVDDILRAVARSGKRYHHTDGWLDEDDGDPSCVYEIQSAANDCARAVQRATADLRRENDELRRTLDAACRLCRSLDDLRAERDAIEAYLRTAGAGVSLCPVSLRSILSGDTRGPENGARMDVARAIREMLTPATTTKGETDDG